MRRLPVHLNFQQAAYWRYLSVFPYSVLRTPHSAFGTALWSSSSLQDHRCLSSSCPAFGSLGETGGAGDSIFQGVTSITSSIDVQPARPGEARRGARSSGTRSLVPFGPAPGRGGKLFAQGQGPANQLQSAPAHSLTASSSHS